MTPEEIAALRQALPETYEFPYYEDRESVWLAHASMRDDMSLRALKTGPLARFFARPPLKPLTAAVDGMIRFSDLAALARAQELSDFETLSPSGLKALEQVFDLPWLDFEVSFTAWTPEDWTWGQMSRPGGNLVVQLGFPSDHASLLERTVGRAARSKFEYSDHPVRLSGRPTLAWARLDIDRKSKQALIEEVQCDWLRIVREELEDMVRYNCPRSRHLRSTKAYEATLRERYGKLWPRAMMLTVLDLLRDTLGLREIFMHQPDPGAVLKGIRWSKPPRSLYTGLPKAFCFEPTREIPAFLRRKRRKHLSRLPRGKPLFWKLAL